MDENREREEGQLVPAQKFLHGANADCARHPSHVDHRNLLGTDSFDHVSLRSCRRASRFSAMPFSDVLDTSVSPAGYGRGHFAALLAHVVHI